MDADDRVVLEILRRGRDDHRVRIKLLGVVDADSCLDRAARGLERAAGRLSMHPAERLRGQDRSEFARGPSSAVRAVKSPASASTSSQRRLSAGRMKTSQKRATD